jgi:hypothetical protein
MSNKKEILESRLKKWEEEKRNYKTGDVLTLDFSGIDSRFIPFIPEGVTRLNFANNKLTMIKSIPYFLTFINLSSNYIKTIPSFSDKLETIILSKNQLISLPELPKNLKHLQVNENRLTSLPKLPKKLEFLDVSSNNLKSLPNMPDTLLNVNASTNSINSIGKISKNIVSLNLKSNFLKNLPIELPDSLKNLDISYNKFETMPIVPSYTKMNISNNPLYINLRKLQPKYVSTHRFSESEESLGSKSFDSKSLYKTVKIPKGTVLFHSAKRMEQFSELFVGYPYNSGPDSEFRLHPQHLSFFYLSPSFQKSEYGPHEGLFILTKDIEVVLGLLPSEDTKRQIELRYQEDCKNLDYDTVIEQKYECFKKNFPTKTGFLTQGYRNFKVDPAVEKFNYFYSYFEDFEGNLNVPEFVIHPRKERLERDLVVRKTDFSYDWLNKHIDEYMFKPFFIFEHNPEDSDMKNLHDYVYKLKTLLSPSGFTDASGTYHMTVHKDEGFYMIAEYTSDEVLKECISVTNPEKEEFLKKIKVA